jgi:hypothetical protein
MLNHIIRKSLVLIVIFLFAFVSVSPLIFSNGVMFNVKAEQFDNAPTVDINIQPYEKVYEGDIINCDISNDPTIMYWQINEQSIHNTFLGDDPVIFNPEPTPLSDTYVNLTVYAENEFGSDSDTVPIKLFRIFFGDIHWHTVFSDGKFNIETQYKHAVEDNYLDFVACTDHGELIDGISFKIGGKRENDFIRTIIEKFLGFSEWKTIKEKAIKYYDPGNFTTLLGFEWTAAEWSLGGYDWTPHGWEDVGHINFYYRDIYPDAREFGFHHKLNYDSIFKAMCREWDKGHLNFGLPHHPIGKTGKINFTTNWTYLADGMRNTYCRNKILRGAETYSRWGNAIGGYFTPDIPWLWPYNSSKYTNQTDAWVENAFWEWSDDKMKGQKFGLFASSDTHDYDRPASALFEDSHLEATSGIVAVFSVHNTREEIWDVMYDCECYASQLLKIRANVRLDGKFCSGRWINCSSPLQIRISAHSTFPGLDSSGRRMWPHGYSPDELDYPITDIWIIKKDRENGRPWCKVINHTKPDSNMAVVLFEDYDVQSNDFYWIAIKQKGQALKQVEGDSYMSFIGPFFINEVFN